MGFRSFWVVGNDGDGFVLPSGFAGGVEGSPYDSLLSGGNGGFSQCNGGASATGFGLPDNQCGVAFVFEGEVTVCLFALNKVAEFDGGFSKWTTGAFSSSFLLSLLKSSAMLAVTVSRLL